MGLVEHPASDFPVGQRLRDHAVSELFRGQVEKADVAHAHLFQDSAAFGRRKQAVDGRDFGDAGPFAQVVDLVLHQGLQWRHNHREQSAPKVADQGRQLEAQRFSSTGRQNTEQRDAVHARFRECLLQGFVRLP